MSPLTMEELDKEYIQDGYTWMVVQPSGRISLFKPVGSLFFTPGMGWNYTPIEEDSDEDGRGRSIWHLVHKLELPSTTPCNDRWFDLLDEDDRRFIEILLTL